VQAAAEPPNVQYSDFSGVSCLAKQGCIAFGGYFTHGSKFGLLAEQHS